MRRNIKNLFWFPFIAIIIFAAVGLLLLIVPEFFVRILPPLIGIVLLILGLQALLSGIALRGASETPLLAIGGGVLSIIVGIIFLVQNNVSVVFISILFGLYIIVTSVLGIADALRGRKAGKPWVPGIVESVIDIVLGLLLLFSPVRGMNLWVRILGIHFILVAVGSLIGLRRVRKQVLLLMPPDPQQPSEMEEDDEKPGEG